MAVLNAKVKLISNPNEPIKQTSKILALTAMVGTGGFMEICKIQPFLNDFQPNPDTPLTSFTLDTAGGLAAQSVTWNTPWADGIYGCQTNSNSVTFNVTGALPAVIYGFVLKNEDDSDWHYAVVLDEPYPVPEADQLEVVATLAIT